ncbi:hypothetical protein ACN47E_000121 [Coniothyrium glycines]
MKSRDEAPTKYAYRALDPATDCIRLMRIEAAQHLGDPVHCKIVHAEFGQLPQYEALSYTWGDDQTIKQTIYVDGLEFEVSKNLFEALRHLRRSNQALTLWADAVCINQNDVAERNNQVRIMPHIYRRAQIVCIWLGLPDYASVQRNRAIPDQVKKLHNTIPISLSEHPYWNRVWIIQEIGKARKLRICYGTCVSSWEAFIDRLKESNTNVAHESKAFNKRYKPLILDRQLRSKDAKNYRLMSLLMVNETSQSKIPHDRIYALLGLAIDAPGFPIDYTKSTYEVWIDTIAYVHNQKIIHKLEIIEFGKLVKRLLGIDANTSHARSGDIFYPQAPTQRSASSNADTHCQIGAYVIGVVFHVGPSPCQMIADFSAVDSWSHAVYQCYPDCLSLAMEENDKFLQAIETWHDSELVNSANTITFAARWEATLPRDIQITIRRSHEQATDSLPESSESDDRRRCFLYGNCESFSQPAIGRIGIGPAHIKKGDFICYVQGLDKAVIVRRSALVKDDPNPAANERCAYTVTGTALLSRRLLMPNAGTTTAQHGYDFDIEVDVAVLFELIT